MRYSSIESLKKVVKEGDLEYLKSVAACEPNECLKRLVISSGDNIFHFIVVAENNNVEFMNEALKILPAPIIQSLLCQGDKKYQLNPLHLAARKGKHKMVKLILEYYISLASTSTDDSKKPWLEQDYLKRTPLHLALANRYERIALEILSMDVELLSSMVDSYDQSPLFMAAFCGFNRTVLQILMSAPNCSLSGERGLTAVHFAACCSAHIFKLLVDKAPQLIIGKHEDGYTVLNTWVESGKLHPFEYVMSQSNDVIPPHLRRDFIDQLSTRTNDTGRNPLHHIIPLVHDDALSVKIAQLLVHAFKQERAELFTSEFQPPWLMKDKYGDTPLHLAIKGQRQQLALYLLSFDKVRFLQTNEDLLSLAIENECPKVAEEILGIVQQHDIQFVKLLTLDNGRNVLHYAPKCTETFLRQVLEAHPEFISESDDDGLSVIHSWMEIGHLFPFEYILQSQWKNNFIREWHTVSFMEGRSPLHVAAVSTFEEDMIEIVKQLSNVSDIKDIFKKSCYKRDNNNNTPIELAISKRHEKLALLFLSMDENLDGAQPDLLFKAIECRCNEVAKFLLEWTTKRGNDKFLRSSERNVLHLVWKSTEEIGKFIVERWPGLINEDDCHRKKPLEIASEKGATWLVKLILQKDRSSVVNAPLAWVEACRNGHLSTVFAFIDESPYFRNICRQHQETPMHHLHKVSYKELQVLLENNLMNEMKNTRNSQGETPLHVAIRNENIDLAEVMLTTDGVDWSIKDNNNQTAKDLLREKCKSNDIWAEMCKMIERDPTLEMTYIQEKTDLIQMQGMVSLVAALLATITFTAAFTLPGGLDSDSGEAILTRKAAFLTFLISDTYAMCCSMLILFCVIWSLVCDRNRSSSLIDRSLQLLKQSLYGTLVAFMSGVYVVIHKKSMWAAIVVIIMCSLVIVLAQRNVLYGALDYLKSSQDESPEAGKRKLSHWRKQASNIKRVFKGKHAKDAPHPAAATHQNEENERAYPDGEHESEIKGKYVKDAPQSATVTHQNDENQTTTLDGPDENEIKEEEASLSNNNHSQIDSIV